MAASGARRTLQFSSASSLSLASKAPNFSGFFTFKLSSASRFSLHKLTSSMSPVWGNWLPLPHLRMLAITSSLLKFRSSRCGDGINEALQVALPL
ncbi:hypothetical protein K2173_003211 [Erythroxylum novogranatense]|uniref:Uncharacterized protein n=1 Tax=Erythroxylum novogranatense TaxID=1862640 RepID=A0AAV8SY66_9ROSI|nr:hypothetical protein K2173_003211 [Erythroxylum novogranatense]